MEFGGGPRAGRRINLGRTAFVALALAVAGPASTAAAAPGAKGKISPKVASKLDRSGSVDAIVSFTPAPATTAAPKLPAGKGRGARVLRAAKPKFAKNKQDAVAAAGTGAQILREWANLPTAFVRFGSQEALEAFARQPGVTGIQPNVRRRRAGVQSLPLIDALRPHSVGRQGAGTYTAVIDGGLAFGRAAFGGCTGIKQPSTCRLEDYHLPGTMEYEPDAHGTNVAGIVAGTAPGTRLFHAQVFGGPDGGGDDDDIIDSVNWAVGKKAAGYNLRAINLSLGGGLYDDTADGCEDSSYASAFATARAYDVLPVVAAGNEANKDGLPEPACVPGAISVGAVYDSAFGSLAQSDEDLHTCPEYEVTAADKVVCWSNSGQRLSMLAPGSRITAAGITQQGTSQAAPHVAGAAAVVAGFNPNLTGNQLEYALTQTGKPISDPLDDYAAHRRLDVCEAIRWSASGTPDTTLPTMVWWPETRINTAVPAGGAVPITLSFSGDDSQGCIRRYRYIVSTDGGATWPSPDKWTWVNAQRTPRTTIALPLLPGVNYRFAVQAEDQSGNLSSLALDTPAYSWPMRAEIRQENGLGLFYSGSWTRPYNRYTLGGYQRATKTYAAAMNLTGATDNVLDVGWVGARHRGGSVARVYVNNTLLGGVSQYGATTQYRRVLWARHNHAPAPTTVSIRNLATSGRPLTTIDAMLVIRRTGG